MIFTHSTLARGFREAAEMIGGPQEAWVTMELMEGDDLMSVSAEVGEQVRQWHAMGMETVCLTDLGGASPFNACALALAQEHALIVTGLHLPFLLELLNLRSQGLTASEAVEAAWQASHDALQVIHTEIMFADVGKREESL